MKILIINAFCGTGSTGRICTDLADELEQQGHTVKIAYGREKALKQYDKYTVRIGNDLDVYLHALETRLFDTCGFGSKQATKKFVKWIEMYDPDVIHLHNLHGYYLNIEILFRYLRICGKKIVWTLHDCWAFTGHCSYFTFAECNKWKQGCSNCPQKKEYPASMVRDNCCENYKRKKKAFTGIENMTLITPSLWLRDLVQESFLQNYPVEVKYNKINTHIFKPTPSNFREKYGLQDKKVILGVANIWEKRKGLDDFVKLSQMLDDRYAIVIVGLSAKQIRLLPKTIKGLRRVNDTRELAAVYTMADVYVNPSKEETFGMTTMEAICCQTPAIVYKDTACEEIVMNQDTEMGIAIEPGVENLYKSITGLDYDKNVRGGYIE